MLQPVGDRFLQGSFPSMVAGHVKLASEIGPHMVIYSPHSNWDPCKHVYTCPWAHPHGHPTTKFKQPSHSCRN